MFTISKIYKLRQCCLSSLCPFSFCSQHILNLCMSMSFLTLREQALGYHEAVSREDAHLQRLMHSGTLSYKVLWKKKNKRFVFRMAGRVQSRSKGKTSNSEVQFSSPHHLTGKQIFKSTITDSRYVTHHPSKLDTFSLTTTVRVWYICVLGNKAFMDLAESSAKV